MRRLVYFFLITGFVHISYGLYVSTWRPIIFASQSTVANESKFYDYPGAVHVQTTQSTGGRSVEEVLKAAKLAGLKFVVFTDFNNFSIDVNSEIAVEDVLAISGGKYSYLDSRLLNIDMKTTDHLQGPGRSQVTFADILSEKNFAKSEGLFYLAHPYKPGYFFTPPYPIGIDGIELLNLKAIWQEAWIKSRGSFIWNCFLYPFNSNLAYIRMLARAGGKELSLWDELNKASPTYGVYGSDAEARVTLFRTMNLEFPSYQTLFSIIKNHLLIKSELTGNASQDRKKISDALRGGQYYMSADILQNPQGFETYILKSDATPIPMGSLIAFSADSELFVKLPAKPVVPFEVHVYKDGERVMTSNSVNTSYVIPAPGNYRVSVRLKVPMPFPERSRWVNWIVANPFFIR